MPDIKRVGVVGCGLMGSGIAEICARAGCAVTVVEADAAALEAGQARVHRSLDRAQKAGKISDADLDATRQRLSFSVDLAELSESDLVIEAILERVEDKLELFSHLDQLLGAEAILASNTSSIPIMRIAMATKRPESVLGLHFFNPVPVMDLVEVIASMRTSPDALARAKSFVSGQLGKHIIDAQDRAGFIVNTLLIPYLLSAIRIYESGFATAEDIDAGMEKGCGHPMGPLRLSDFIGLDTVKFIADSLYAEHRQEQYVVPSLLLRMLDGGYLGRKSGQGFYSYAR